MILDTIANASLYAGINEGINKVLELAKELVCAYSRYDRLEGDVRLNVGEVPRPYNRVKFKEWQIC